MNSLWTYICCCSCESPWRSQPWDRLRAACSGRRSCDPWSWPCESFPAQSFWWHLCAFWPVSCRRRQRLCEPARLVNKYNKISQPADRGLAVLKMILREVCRMILEIQARLWPAGCWFKMHTIKKPTESEGKRKKRQGKERRGLFVTGLAVQWEQSRGNMAASKDRGNCLIYW